MPCLLALAACDDREAPPLAAALAGAGGLAAQAGAGGSGASGAAGSASGPGGAGNGPGAGGQGGAGAPAWASCQDSDEAFVQRASVAALGHRVAGREEARLLADLKRAVEAAGGAGAAGKARGAVLEALVRRGGGDDYARRWTDTVADFIRVQRVDEVSIPDCYGVSLRPDDGALAAMVRDQPAWPPPSSSAPFTVRDLIQSALRLDDLSPIYVAQPLAMVHRSFTGANADPDALEMARRAAFGSWFSGVFLRRDVACLGCHNGEFSVTFDEDPAKNRHFPVQPGLERALFDDPTGPAPLGGADGAARLAAPFRFAGFSVGSLTVPSESGSAPWGWLDACGSFAAPGKASTSVAPVDAELGAVRGVDATGWDVSLSLQRGFQKLRQHGLTTQADQVSDPDEALAYLTSMSLVEQVWGEITGGRLTLAHGFPRNAAARDRLSSLTEGFVASGFSLRSVLLAVLDDPLFNPPPPSAGCGESAAPWPAVLDPWTVGESDPALRGNGPGDLVAPLPARTLLRAARFALDWASEPLDFPPDQAERDLRVDIGAFQKNPEPGFRGFDAQATLAWELRFGRCARPEGAPPDAIDRIAAAARSSPDATLEDALAALKDRFVGEPQVADERDLIESLVGQPPSALAASLDPASLDRGLRLLCGVLLASPQFRLSGLEAGPAPSPRLQAFPEASYDALCQPLHGVAVAGGLRVRCQPGAPVGLE